MQAENDATGEGSPVAMADTLQSDAVPIPLGSPQPADLLTSFLPYDRAAVESAVDSFLDQFEVLGVGLTDFANLGSVVPGIVAVAAATGVTAIMLRRRRSYSRNQQSPANSQAALDLFASPSNLWKLGAL